MYQRILQLAGHSVIYGAGSIISKVIAIIMLPLISRYLPPQSLGLAEAVMVLDLFAAAIFRLGLQNAMMRFAYDAPEHERDDVQKRVVQTTIALTLITTLVGALIMGLFAHQLAEFFMGDSRRDEFIWLAAFGMWTSVIYSTVTATFRIQKRPHAYLGVSLSNVVLSSFLSIYFITELGWGVEGYLLGNFLGYLALVPVAALMQRSMVLPLIDAKLIKPMLRFAIPTIPIAMAFQGLTLIDRTVISRAAGLSELGLYGFASKFAGVVLLVVTALQLSWQPFAYSIKDDGEAKRSYAIVTSWFAAVMGWLIAGISLLADPVIRGLSVPAYYESAKVVPLLSVAVGIYGVYFLVGIGASRVKRTGWHALVAGGAVLVSLAANLALVPQYGMYGAAVAAVLANGALAGFMLLRSQRVFHVDYELLRIARPVLLLIGAVVLAYTLPTGTGLDSWGTRLLVAFSFPVLLVLSGFVTPAERMRIVRLLRRGGSGGGPEVPA